MCGISGIWTLDLSSAEATRRTVAATRALAHRGPDDEGVEQVSWPSADSACPLIVFGHRRLSILDLSAAGHQPMSDPVSGNWITYNGEIYNFLELRADLENRGHRFVSSGDTEVILKAYAEWGVGCWRRLRGIFAFALWDRRYRELHLVRDHLGVKPLYFSGTSKTLIFASEVRAILAGGLTERRLAIDGLASYLKYGSVQEPCTMVMGVESLLPGHYLTCEESGRRTVRRFWCLDESVLRNWPCQPSAEGVLMNLEDTVRRQLISDVPVGVFLSGGIDSTAIAALAASAQPGAVRTFCIGSEDSAFDESNEAAETAALLGCKHTTLILEGRMVRERWQHALGSYDQPSSDGINTYFISLLVRQAGIKVALSGLGGDELFVGYSGFRKSLRLGSTGRWIDLLPSSLRTHAAHLVSRCTSPGAAAAGVITELLEPDLASPYFASRLLFGRSHADQLLPKTGRRELSSMAWGQREAALARLGRKLEGVDQVSFFELQTYLVSTLLRDSDQMSMAHGLELRVPLVDPNLVEQVFSISTKQKTGGNGAKRLLVDALNNLIPPAILQRPKRGFTLPFQQWLSKDLETSVATVFNSNQLRGPWDTRAFNQVWLDFRRGRVAWSRVLTLFVLEKWMAQNSVSV